MTDSRLRGTRTGSRSATDHLATRPAHLVSISDPFLLRRRDSCDDSAYILTSACPAYKAQFLRLLRVSADVLDGRACERSGFHVCDSGQSFGRRLAVVGRFADITDRGRVRRTSDIKHQHSHGRGHGTSIFFFKHRIDNFDVVVY